MQAHRLKAQIRKAIKFPFGPGNGIRHNGQKAELSHLISKLYDSIDIAGITNPDHHTSLAFDLFRNAPCTVEFVKDTGGGEEKVKRFKTMLREIEAGRSPITVREGIEILNTTNELIGNTQPHELTGADVGWHFRACSSFAAKGRVLYNTVRFFRPRSLLEIGTAYGMSAMFMLLALEKYGRGGKLRTIEPLEPQFSLSRRHLGARFEASVECRYGWSHDHIPALCAEGRRFDLVFHDNGHSGEAYINDFKRFASNLAGSAVVIYDDIRWFDRSAVARDPQCYRGWKAIVEDSRIRQAAEINGNIGIALAGG